MEVSATVTTERSEADVLDQQRELVDWEESPESVAPALIPEADPGDLHEQSRTVVFDDEDEEPG
jgi:hypothetical protein